MAIATTIYRQLPRLFNSNAVSSCRSLNTWRSRTFSSAAAAATTHAVRSFSSNATMYRSGDRDICFHFATENCIVNMTHSNVLFLWLNNTTVTIGRHQNAWKECKLAELEKDGVRLVRRMSGGGAVMQDLGCLTFTLIGDMTPEQDLKSFTEKNFELITAGLERAGISNCIRSGRNDIVWQSNEGEDIVYKISGSAFKQLTSSTGRKRLIHHGTLLFDTDFGALGRYLTPNKAKLEAKGIASVQSRVKNLKDISGGALTMEKLQRSIEDEFWTRRGDGSATPDAKILVPDTPELVADPTYLPFLEKISDWNFRFGQTPEFSHKMGPVRLEKDDGVALGMFEMHLQVNDGMITKSVCFSDSLLPDAITRLNDGFNNVKYDESASADKLKSLATTPDEDLLMAKLAEWVCREIKE